MPEPLELRRRPRREVLEHLPPMVVEVMEEWNKAIEKAGGVPDVFKDVNMKILALDLVVEAVLPDAPDE